MLLEQKQIACPMQDIASLQSDFLSTKNMNDRKTLGQFFTGSIVADYMASLVKRPKSKNIRILDAGAGTGILTAATAMRCLELDCDRVHAVLYELDDKAIPSLLQTLKVIKNIFNDDNRIFTYEIHNKDFVLSRPDKNIDKFDVSVINPPYFKYNVKESPYSKATQDLYKGDPNIYASFMAIVLASLNEYGQMVSITPRSFTNGLYFKGLRSYLLSNSSLELVHIFKRRDKVFNSDDSAVLQENIICSFIKGVKYSSVCVRSSECDNNIDSTEEDKYSSKLIIDPTNNQQIIRIPESASEASILKQAENLATTFEDAGYFISTGRVVEHRTREFITTDNSMDNKVPLYRPHNITPFIATWTGKHKKDTSFILDNGHDKHTIKNDVYVLLKRFSSKDEKRRLVSSIHKSNNFNCDVIGFGNKTNYIGVNSNDLGIVEAYGLCAVFNSTFMDKYFRCISGNTQVNATEIRIMKFPTRKQVIEIGKQLHKLEDIKINNIDDVVNNVLDVMETA